MPTKRCPYCSSDTGIRTILCGMPSEEPDPAIHTIGGCCISDDMQKYECVQCGWKVLMQKLENRGKMLSHQNLVRFLVNFYYILITKY